MKRLFLDDYRSPKDCTNYMYRRGVDCKIYHEEWYVVTSYGEFVKWILENGVPDVISLDYDLTDVDELLETIPKEYWFDLVNNRVYTGEDCAKWLKSFCDQNNRVIPTIYIHSVNPDGLKKIQNIFRN